MVVVGLGRVNWFVDLVAAVGGGARINTPAGQDGSSRRGGEEALVTIVTILMEELPSSRTAARSAAPPQARRTGEGGIRLLLLYSIPISGFIQVHKQFGLMPTLHGPWPHSASRPWLTYEWPLAHIWL